MRQEYRVAILVGFFGSFTTFSTFGYETFALMADREWLQAAIERPAEQSPGIAGGL